MTCSIEDMDGDDDNIQLLYWSVDAYVLFFGSLIHSLIKETLNSEFCFINRPSDKVPFDGFKTKYSLFRIVLVLAIIFNIALPKGGFDVVGIPITWGYIILFVIIFFTLLKGLLLTKIETYRFLFYLKVYF